MRKKMKAPHIFLCYSSQDRLFVHRLARDLLNLGVYPWLDQWELSPGDSLHDCIGRALENSTFVGVLLSPMSIQSVWCKKELYQALSRETRSGKKVVIPLRYRRVQIPPFLEDRLYLDFSKSYIASITQLVALIHHLNQRIISESLSTKPPKTMNQAKRILRKAGWDEAVLVDRDDYDDLRRMFKRYKVDILSDWHKMLLADKRGIIRTLVR